MTVILHVCPILLGQARKVIAELGRNDIEVQALRGGPEAAMCELRRDDGAPEPDFQVVLGGACVKVAKQANVFRPNPPWNSCFEAFLSSERVSDCLDRGAHFLAPEMLTNAKPVWRRWGFSSAEDARSFVADSMRSLVEIRNDDDPRQHEIAQALARDLAVPLEVQQGSADRLKLWIRLALAEAEAATMVPRWRRRVAEYQLAFDLVQSLSSAPSLSKALESVRQVLEGLFGAKVSISLHKTKRTEFSITGPTRSTDSASGRPSMIDDGQRFSLPLRVAGRSIGEMSVTEITDASRRHDYLTLALTLAPMLSEAIARFEKDRHEQRQRRLTRTVFEATHEGIMVTDEHAVVLAVNPAFEQITGYAAAEVVGRNPRMLQSGRHNSQFYAAMWSELQTSGHWSGEVFNRKRDGSIYRQRLDISTVYGDDNSVSCFVGNLQDITAEYQSRADLEHRATHDVLTELGNRDWLAARLRWALDDAEMTGKSVAVIFIDLDHFKWINDVYGHDAGDALLRQVAARLREAIRRGDGVARVGGDEFVVVASGLAEPSDALKVSELLLARLLPPYQLTNTEITVTISIGVAIYPHDAATPEALLTASDNAMYRAKENGRNRVESHDRALAASRDHLTRLRAQIATSLSNDGIRVVYQPIVRLADGAAVGAEALARMSDADGVAVPPDVFIPVAERYGHINDLGAQVLRKALQDAASWPVAADGTELYVSVNVAAAQLHGAVNAPWLADLCLSKGLPPRRLVLEVVERTVIDEATIRRKELASLQDIGVRVALDDFGTGYTALSYLRNIDANIVKIDRSFLTGIPGDPEAEAMLDAIAGMLLRLGRKVVVEGVETEDQRAWLQGIGCELGQGYLWAKPMDADAFVDWLSKQRPEKPNPSQR